MLFLIEQDNHIEAPEDVSKKIKLFFSHAADTWDAEFYAKVNDDIYVNLGKLFYIKLSFVLNTSKSIPMKSIGKH